MPDSGNATKIIYAGSMAIYRAKALTHRIGKPCLAWGRQQTGSLQSATSE